MIKREILINYIFLWICLVACIVSFSIGPTLDELKIQTESLKQDIKDQEQRLHKCELEVESIKGSKDFLEIYNHVVEVEKIKNN